MCYLLFSFLGLGVSAFSAVLVGFKDGEALCSVCGVASDGMGDHLVTCHGNGDMLMRHNCLRDILFTACSTAALSPHTKVPSHIPGSTSHQLTFSFQCGIKASLQLLMFLSFAPTNF
uniref:Secreted protein n=1 Tax=Amphimedon queenslandica TaxID=400682 RepID=A0A1X7UCJ1_AMPQE